MNIRILAALAAIAAAIAAAAVSGCGHSDPVPAAGGGTTGRLAALHAAAECARTHGIPNFADPVLGANGQVFTDTRAMQNVPQATLDAAHRACQSKLAAANWNPDQQPPAPAALVAAGVQAAQCLRRNGLPNYRDPTATSEYTPGHGFGMRADELPPGATKASPVIQHAFSACRSLLNAEIRASTLTSLSGK